MLTIIKQHSRFIATNGKAVCVLPAVEREDPESGRHLTEVVTASGIRSMFRTAVDVSYVQRCTEAPDGTVVTDYVPKSRIIDSLPDLIVRLANDKFAGELVRIGRIRNGNEASRELKSLLDKVIGLLFKEQWDWESSTSFETYANSMQAIVLDTPLPVIDGRFAAETEAQRRLDAARALMKSGPLSSPCSTGTGSPGKSFYLSEERGYSVTELTNPLIHEAPEKRRGVINATKNAVDIVGAEPSPVHLKSVKRTPPMTNTVVVCMPAALDDSIIISESLAERLTAKLPQSNYYNIDGLVNYRGGLRPFGRNGELQKRAAEWAVANDRKEMPEGYVLLTQRTKEVESPVVPASRDADLLMELRQEFLSKYAGVVKRLGLASAEEMKAFKIWLSHQPKWTQRLKKPDLIRRFEFGVEVVNHNDRIFFRENLGVHYRKPEVGMKLQSDADLFKGVVSKILPDDKMPLVRLAGKLVRAEVVCEMGKSTKKHGSLRLAHGQIALYALARHVGGLGLVGEPAVEDIADLAMAAGVYEDDSLTCDVFDCTGTVIYGRFPAGVTRVCRHKQDPSVVSAVCGQRPKRPLQDGSTVKSGGCVLGLADVFCMLAAGLKESAKELRAEIPSGAALNLELLTKAVQ